MHVLCIAIERCKTAQIVPDYGLTLKVDNKKAVSIIISETAVILVML